MKLLSVVSDPAKDAQRIMASLVCGACSELMFEPVTLSCGKSICKRCFRIPRQGLEAQIKAYKCPIRSCGKKHRCRNEKPNVMLCKCLDKLLPVEMSALALVKQGELLLRPYFSVDSIFVGGQADGCADANALLDRKSKEAELRHAITAHFDVAIHLAPHLQLPYLMRSKCLAELGEFDAASRDAQYGELLNPFNKRGLVSERLVVWRKKLFDNNMLKTLADVATSSSTTPNTYKPSSSLIENPSYTGPSRSEPTSSHPSSYLVNVQSMSSSPSGNSAVVERKVPQDVRVVHHSHHNFNASNGDTTNYQENRDPSAGNLMDIAGNGMVILNPVTTAAGSSSGYGSASTIGSFTTFYPAAGSAPPSYISPSEPSALPPHLTFTTNTTQNNKSNDTLSLGPDFPPQSVINAMSKELHRELAEISLRRRQPGDMWPQSILTTLQALIVSLQNTKSLQDRGLIEKSDLECSLCLQSIHEPITCPCGHSWCRDCILSAVEHSDQCPMCRCKLPMYGFLLKRPQTELLNEFISIFLEPRPPNSPKSVERKPVPIFICTITFPGSHQNLHMFESRYRVMIKRCIAGEKKFVSILPSLNPTADSPCVDHGVMMVINDFQPLVNCDIVSTPEGHLPRYLISCTAQYRVKISNIKRNDAGYFEGDVERVEDIDAEDSTPNWDPTILSQLTMKAKNFVMSILSKLPPSARFHFERKHGKIPEDPYEFSFWIAEFLPIPPHTVYQIFPLTDVEQRMRLVCEWIQKIDVGFASV